MKNVTKFADLTLLKRMLNFKDVNIIVGVALGIEFYSAMYLSIEKLSVFPFINMTDFADV